jgi:hypothetical protein
VLPVLPPGRPPPWCGGPPPPPPPLCSHPPVPIHTMSGASASVRTPANAWGRRIIRAVCGRLLLLHALATNRRCAGKEWAQSLVGLSRSLSRARALSLALSLPPLSVCVCVCVLCPSLPFSNPHRTTHAGKCHPITTTAGPPAPHPTRPGGSSSCANQCKEECKVGEACMFKFLEGQWCLNAAPQHNISALFYMPPPPPFSLSHTFSLPPPLSLPPFLFGAHGATTACMNASPPLQKLSDVQY